MIKAAIEKVQDLVKLSIAPQTITLEDGREYHYIEGRAVASNAPKQPSLLRFTTLDGLCDYINSEYDQREDANPMVIVESYDCVSFTTECYSEFWQRDNLAQATPVEMEKFPFGKWLSVEEFIIKAQCGFDNVGDKAAMINACAGIKRMDGVDYRDSGVSQTVAVQKGVSLATQKAIPNPVMLAPFRTFPEIAQPISPFVLRVSEDRDGAPTIGLFEADGGAWKVSCIRAIATYLKERVGDSALILA